MNAGSNFTTSTSTSTRTDRGEAISWILYNFVLRTDTIIDMARIKIYTSYTYVGVCVGMLVCVCAFACVYFSHCYMSVKVVYCCK